MRRARAWNYGAHRKCSEQPSVKIKGVLSTSSSGPMYGLSLCSWNANGIKSKIHEFKFFVEKHCPDVILIQETHLRPSQRININNYNCYRNDRITDGTASGGTLILIKNTIPHFTPPPTPLQHIEATIITLDPPNINPLTITSIYIPPQSDKYCFTQDLENILQINSNCVIFGDFNATHNDFGIALIIQPEYGFTRQLSTYHPLLRLTEKPSAGFQRGRSTGAVFLDIQKAFDRVRISGLIYKLIINHFPAPLIHIINSYLVNRTFKKLLRHTPPTPYRHSNYYDSPANQSGSSVLLSTISGNLHCSVMGRVPKNIILVWFPDREHSPTPIKVIGLHSKGIALLTAGQRK
ncbi:RNA-directed DNA polymerase from mobile element jockey [Trichonephila clavipes]|nr:RNA-directed DNA polymerase from mobile element jockey [Trichonephila clavipes]